MTETMLQSLHLRHKTPCVLMPSVAVSNIRPVYSVRHPPVPSR